MWSLSFFHLPLSLYIYVCICIWIYIYIHIYIYIYIYVYIYRIYTYILYIYIYYLYILYIFMYIYYKTLYIIYIVYIQEQVRKVDAMRTLYSNTTGFWYLLKCFIYIHIYIIYIYIYIYILNKKTFFKTVLAVLVIFRLFTRILYLKIRIRIITSSKRKRRGSRSELFYRVDDFKIFAKFKPGGLQKRDSSTGVFLWILQSEF